MKIVILDAYTANPGDLSWDKLKEFGDILVYERTPQNLAVERSQGAEIVLVNKVLLRKQEIDGLPNLKYIGLLSTGTNVVDIVTARQRGITVTNVPAYSTMSVAQLVFSYILEHTHHVNSHSAGVKSGKWASSKDFSYWDYPVVELDGMTMGIIGYGRIGKAVAGIAKSFGMRVIAVPHNMKSSSTEGVEFVDIEAVFMKSDFLSLHCPLNAETDGIINTDNIRKMKSTAFIINTGRGGLVKEQDLADALNEGLIAGAAVDVLTVEPPEIGNPLLNAANCMITPHIGWTTQSARKRLIEIVAENIKAYISGKPQNVVS